MAAFEVIALDTATPQLRAPGASDTYTFPRAVEMPLGTANGVLYLNGSKVVTSGSALTFDGTNFTYQSAISLLNNDGNGNKALLTPFAYGGSGATGTLVLSSTYGNANQQRIRVGVGGVSAISFDIDSAEQMRLTSTGLGIGTSNPQRKLHVVSNNPLRMGQASDYFDFVQSNNNLWSWLSDSSIICMQMNGATGAVVISGLLNTTATDGFLYVPTCAGTPTGTPTTYTGRAPIVIDTTNNKLYFYSGGQWRDAGP